MTDSRSFVVVPFQRVGSYVGAQQMFIFRDAGEAQAWLRKLSHHCPGVALIERRTDGETGDDVDTLVESFGAVPSGMPSSASWSMALH